MSTFSEIKHHNISCFVPFTTGFVYVSSVPFLFGWRHKKRPMRLREFSSIIRNITRIRNTIFPGALFSPFNVVIHWHEYYPSLEVLRFTLYFSHPGLNLGEDLQCSESCEILPLELHQLSIESIQFSILKWILKPVDLLLSSFDGILSDPSHTQYWVGECIGFCIWWLNYLVSEQSYPLPSLLLPVDHGYTLDFFLIPVSFPVTLNN